jgi:hypothetical protein
MISTVKPLVSSAEVYPSDGIGAEKNPETGVVHFVAIREQERTLPILIHFFAEQHKLPLKWMNQIVLSVRHLS